MTAGVHQSGRLWRAGRRVGRTQRKETLAPPAGGGYRYMWCCFTHGSCAWPVGPFPAGWRWPRLLWSPGAQACSWPCNRRVPQGTGLLGDRLQRVCDVMPPGPDVIIGTDIPSITPADIAAAFRCLGSHDAVFGPSQDGGYWLIGLKRRPNVPRPFDRVRWSSQHALSDTGENLSRFKSGLKIAYLRHLDDVDTVDDLAGQRPFIGRRILPTPVDCR